MLEAARWIKQPGIFVFALIISLCFPSGSRADTALESEVRRLRSENSDISGMLQGLSGRGYAADASVYAMISLNVAPADEIASTAAKLYPGRITDIAVAAVRAAPNQAAAIAQSVVETNPGKVIEVLRAVVKEEPREKNKIAEYLAQVTRYSQAELLKMAE